MTAITSGRVTIPVWRVMRAAWFRNRTTLTVLLAVFAAAACWTLYQAGSMRSWLVAHHLQHCMAQVNGTSPACQSALSQYQLTAGFHPYYVIFVLLGAPVMLAMFGGVRWLTREYETGTFRYTWTLGVSRVRWLAGTLLPLLAVVTAGAVACGLAYDRWFPEAQWVVTGSTSGVPWEWKEFPLTPLTFTALALTGFGIAACAAALIRRTVPAMAATAVTTGVVAYLADTRFRAWMLTLHPITTRAEYSDPVGSYSKGDYLLRGWLTGPTGHVAPGFLVTHGGGPRTDGPLATVLGTGTGATQRAWLAAHHYTYWISYQPPGRLLTFQAAWSGTLLLVAVAAFGLAIWRVRASR